MGQNSLRILDKKILKETEKGHYILISESIHQEDITSINIHAPKAELYNI